MNDAKLIETAALDAVRRAAVVCRAVQGALVDASTLEKKDKSPVTVADFASQAVVCAVLRQYLGSESVVGEENSRALRQAENEALRSQVVAHARAAMRVDVGDDEVMDWIDLGDGDARGGRYWTLDPIDGTKGFLRGEQYAIALALIEDGEVVFGVLGCPNLQQDAATGSLLVAARGQGARQLDLWNGDESAGESIRVSQLSAISEARFCESVESGHSDHAESAEIARRLRITREPLRMDSQCKYACVGRGDASIYLRLPTRADYQEKIWDHAAGMIVVEEAGGRVSDIRGRPLDFNQGRTLANNQGIIATCGAIHEKLLEAVAAVVGE